MDTQAMVAEVMDRVRRIETRTTKLAHGLNVDVGASKPEWRNGRIYAPTPNCSVADCLAVVPDSWSEEVEVYVRDELLMSILRR